MISPWTIYWTLQLDTLQFFFQCATVIFGILSIVGVVILAIGCEPSNGTPRKLLFMAGTVLTLFLIASVIWTVTPSTKTMCAVLTIPVVVNNETLQADAEKIYELGLERFKDILTPETPEE